MSVFVQEPLTLTRLENSIKADKPKPVRRKNIPDSIIAPLLDTKSTQHPPCIKGNLRVSKHKTLDYFQPNIESKRDKPIHRIVFYPTTGLNNPEFGFETPIMGSFITQLLGSSF